MEVLGLGGSNIFTEIVDTSEESVPKDMHNREEFQRLSHIIAQKKFELRAIELENSRTKDEIVEIDKHFAFEQKYHSHANKLLQESRDDYITLRNLYHKTVTASDFELISDFGTKLRINSYFDKVSAEIKISRKKLARKTRKANQSRILSFLDDFETSTVDTDNNGLISLVNAQAEIFALDCMFSHLENKASKASLEIDHLVSNNPALVSLVESNENYILKLVLNWLISAGKFRHHIEPFVFYTARRGRFTSMHYKGMHLRLIEG